MIVTPSLYPLNGTCNDTSLNALLPKYGDT